MRMRSGKCFRNDIRLLHALPTELFDMIIRLLDAPDIVALRSTDKYARLMTQQAFQRVLYALHYARLTRGRSSADLREYWEQAKAQMAQQSQLTPGWSNGFDKERGTKHWEALLSWINEDEPESSDAVVKNLDQVLKTLGHVEEFDPRHIIRRIDAVEYGHATEAEQSQLANENTIEFDAEPAGDFGVRSFTTYQTRALLSSMMRTGFTCKTFSLIEISPMDLIIRSNDVPKSLARLEVSLRRTRTLRLVLSWNSWENDMTPDERAFIRPRAVARFANCATNIERLQLQLVTGYDGASQSNALYWNDEGAFDEEFDVLFKQLRSFDSLRSFSLQNVSDELSMTGLCDFLGRQTTLEKVSFNNINVAAEQWPQIYTTLEKLSSLMRLSMELVSGEIEGELRTLVTYKRLGEAGELIDDIGENESMDIRGAEMIQACLKRHTELFKFRCL